MNRQQRFKLLDELNKIESLLEGEKGSVVDGYAYFSEDSARAALNQYRVLLDRYIEELNHRVRNREEDDDVEVYINPSAHERGRYRKSKWLERIYDEPQKKILANTKDEDGDIVGGIYILEWFQVEIRNNWTADSYELPALILVRFEDEEGKRYYICDTYAGGPSPVQNSSLRAFSDAHDYMRYIKRVLDVKRVIEWGLSFRRID